VDDIFGQMMGAEQVALCERAGAMAKANLDGRNLDEAIEIGRRLLVGRRIAMDLAHTSRPKGRGYIQTYSRWKKRFGFPDGPGTAAYYSAVIVIAEHETLARQIISDTTPGRRANLGVSGLAARVRAKLQPAGKNRPPSPVAKIKEQLRDTEGQLADAEERIAARRRRRRFQPAPAPAGSARPPHHGGWC
jgi:hypothetical protein